MEKPEIFILIVIYNKKCTDLMPFFQAFFEKECTLMVYDNSAHDLGNRAFCEAYNVVYLGGNGNQGLSKAYNVAVEYCRHREENGYLCIFDDDTTIIGDYLDVLTRATVTGEKAVFVPLLRVGSKIISPAILKENFHCRFFTDKEEVEAYHGDRLTALNSGMVIHLSIFEHYRYDERLFLDGIDHTFMKDMRVRQIPVRILDFQLEHHISSFEKPTIDSAIHRFRIFKNDVKVFAGSRYRSILWRRLLKLTLQYRTLAFFKQYKV